MDRKWLIVLILLCFELAGFSQVKQDGVPHIRHYSRHDYQGGTQSWSMVQSDQGIVYIANNSGILQFDGVHWKLYPMRNFSVVRTIAKNDEGNIYAGAYNEIGVLKTNQYQEGQYKSLVPKIPQKHRDFGEVWKIHNTRDGVVFQSFSTILLYHNDTIQVLADDRNFHFSFYLNNTLYISEWDKGLMKFTGDDFVQMAGGEFFRRERKIWSMHALDSAGLLIGTQDDGLFVYRNGDIEPWNTPANEFLKQHQLFSAAKLPKGHYAFGSIQNGLIISDKQGRIMQHLNKKQGLANNTILSVNIDQWGNLWCGLDNGINYIEIHSPLTYLDDALSIQGTGYISATYNEKLYMGTNQGAYFTDFRKNDGDVLSDVVFQELPGMKGQVWNMKVIDDRLFCGHNKGTFIIRDDEIKHSWNAEGCWEYLAVPGNDSLIVAGTYDGLARFVKKNGGWHFDGKIKGFNESSREIAFDKNKDLWMSHGYTGVYRIRFNAAMDSVVNYTHYDKEYGISKNYRDYMFIYKDDVLVSRPDSIFKYNYLTNRFEFSPELTNYFGSGVSRVFMDRYENLWYFLRGENKVRIKLSEQSPWEPENMEILNKLDDRFVEAFEYIHVIDSNNVLFGVEVGFAHLDPLLVDQLHNDFNTIITGVEAYGKKDSISQAMSITSNRQDSIVMKFPASINTMKFSYAAAFFENAGQNTYSYRLDQFNDGNWSQWQDANIKEYTNLPSGDYVFSVKARNVYGVESKPVSFAFTVLPPWYRTVWAYISYVIVAGMAILLLLRFVEGYIQNERESLDRQRKQELMEKEKQHQRQSLELENEIIQLKNEKLQAEIARKKSDVELKNKELASFAVQINHKNEILTNLRTELERVRERVNKSAQIQLSQLNRKIDEDLQLDDDWKKFKMHFDQVQGDFIHNMQEKYPNLTPKDLKLCAFLRMNLTTKEIAPLMNISVRGVEIHRYRLRKKLGITRDTNLVEFLMQQ